MKMSCFKLNNKVAKRVGAAAGVDGLPKLGRYQLDS